VIDLFREWDVSSNGHLSHKEFERGVRRLGYPADAASIHALFKSWDIDGSGTISLAEMNKILRRGGTVKLPEHIRFDAEAHARRQQEEKRKKLHGVATKLHRALNRKAKRESGPALNNDQEKLLKKLAKKKEKLLSFFATWDTNNDGFICRAELHKSLPLVGIAADKTITDALFDTMDYQTSGKIPLDHLQSCLCWAMKSNTKKSGILHVSFDDETPVHEQIRDALTQNAMRVIDLFREFDENGDGEISQDEFSKALPMLGVPADKAQATRVFDDFDVDSSGAISFREFNKLLRRDVAARRSHKSKKQTSAEHVELLSPLELKKEVIREYAKLIQLSTAEKVKE